MHAIKLTADRLIAKLRAGNVIKGKKTAVADSAGLELGRPDEGAQCDDEGAHNDDLEPEDQY